MEKDLWELERLRQYATELHNLIAEAGSVAPERAEATDRSRAIRMAIGPDGLPETVRVAADWQRRIDPGAVGAAVLEAYGACVQRRSEEWAQVLEHLGFADRIRMVDELQAETNTPIPPPPNELPAAFLPDTRNIRPRPTDLIAEDVLSAADTAIAAVARARQSPRVSGSGTTRRREVTITLSPGGLVSCEVDRDWAARQTGVRLTEALRGALASARENLAAGQHAWTGDTTSRLTDLLMEIFAATFNDPKLRTDR